MTRVAVILNSLEDKDLIERSIDPKDRRKIIVKLIPNRFEFSKT